MGKSCYRELELLSRQYLQVILVAQIRYLTFFDRLDDLAVGLIQMQAITKPAQGKVLGELRVLPAELSALDIGALSLIHI